MPLREDILAPIPGENPSGVDLRYDTKLLIFDKIKEARRQDDELDAGRLAERAQDRQLAAGRSSLRRILLPLPQRICNWPPI